MEWQGKKVTVMGLGLLGGGLGSAQYAVKKGAEVIVTDLRDEKTLASSLNRLQGLSIRFILGEHRKEDFRNADIIIRNPGVPDTSPYLDIAREAGVAIESEASIFLKECSAFLVGVTGTKGKSSTAHFIAEGLRGEGFPTVLTGLPGTSLCQSLLDLEKQKKQIVVAEFSSWDLELGALAEKSPQVAVITNFFPDHLNRHKTMNAYRDAKALLVQFQTAADALVLSSTNTVFLSLIKEKPPAGSLEVVTDEDVAAVPALALPGRHQRENAALALRAIRVAVHHAQFPLPSPQDLIRAQDAIAKCGSLPGRLELVGEYAGRRFLNDTTATNPGASCAALDAVDAPIVLIAGGEDKELPYNAFADAIAKKVKYCVLFRGSASKKISQRLAQRGFSAVTKDITTMEAAVARSWRASDKGDTILLSPGAASFNLFQNEFDRGNQFAECLHQLRRSGSV